VRGLIQSRLQTGRESADARGRLLASVIGPVSSQFLDTLDRPLTDAAVLLGLVERPAGLTMLVTERALHLRDHPGQISFPGGRVAPGDRGPIETALREAREEVGLEAGQVAVIGSLDVHLTVTGFAVTPVVGFVADRFSPAADPAEVAAVFEVPLDYILDERNIVFSTRERFGTRFRVAELNYRGHRIWGATASMLIAFRNLIIDEKT
jgi:8-oxo-dGTP pyrophosphatase MutT (NUDIX family)